MEWLTNWLAECCIYCLGVDRLIHRLKNLELTVWLWSWVKRFKKSTMATMKNHNFNIWIKEGLCFSLTTCRWSSEIISRPILSPNNLDKIFAPKHGFNQLKNCPSSVAPGLNQTPYVGWSLLLVLSLPLRGFSPGTPVSPSPKSGHRYCFEFSSARYSYHLGKSGAGYRYCLEISSARYHYHLKISCAVYRYYLEISKSGISLWIFGDIKWRISLLYGGRC